MSVNINNAPLLVVTIMVKDEALTIIKTLESFLTSKTNYFFVLDTGSKDNTVDVVKEFYTRPGVVGFIEQEKFIDFAASRNRTLELAEKYFPNAKFFIMPDAEWRLSNPELLIEFCKQEKDIDTPLYLINIYFNTTEFTTARLFRVSHKNRFKGVVHEAPITPTEIKCPKQIYFTVHSSQQGIDKSRSRWQKDLLLLTDAFNKDKSDPRVAFYLAQTYECLNLYESAYQIYLHRSTLDGFDEENFITYFRLGCIADILKSSNNNFTWELAMQHYLQAFKLRAHRIEPLVKIAMHYWPENINTCYLFIKHAYDIPYPNDDILFIEKEMYNYDRYEVMSRCAWYLQEYKLGEEATLKALESHPEMEHLHRNLNLYQSKLNKHEKDRV